MAHLIRLVVEVRREIRTYGGHSGREVGLSVGFFSSPPLVLQQEGAAAEAAAAAAAAPTPAGPSQPALTFVLVPQFPF